MHLKIKFKCIIINVKCSKIDYVYLNCEQQFIMIHAITSYRIVHIIDFF